MIKSITAKVNNRSITFVSSDGTNWYVSSVSPDAEGVYDVTLSVETDSGIVYTYSTNDAQFGEYLKLYVTNHDSRLIEYLPEFLREVMEFKALFETEDYEVDILYPSIESIFAEVIIMYCSEERLSQWEEALNIIPKGTVDERRYYVKSVLRGSGKLNEEKIKSIVDAFTGGEAIVTFGSSVITVKILPPNNGEVYRFPDVERALKPLVPAHLGLSVLRYYSTWADIKKNYADWNAVSQAEDWKEIRNYIAP